MIIILIKQQYRTTSLELIVWTTFKLASCFSLFTNTSPYFQDQDITEHENNFLDLSIGTGSSGDLGETEVGLQVGHSKNFTLSPETTDCDSNCGDLDSEVSLMLMENEMGPSGGFLGIKTFLLRFYIVKFN